MTIPQRDNNLRSRLVLGARAPLSCQLSPHDRRSSDAAPDSTRRLLGFSWASLGQRTVQRAANAKPDMYVFKYSFGWVIVRKIPLHLLLHFYIPFPPESIRLQTSSFGPGVFSFKIRQSSQFEPFTWLLVSAQAVPVRERDTSAILTWNAPSSFFAWPSASSFASCATSHASCGLVLFDLSAKRRIGPSETGTSCATRLLHPMNRSISRRVHRLSRARPCPRP